MSSVIEYWNKSDNKFNNGKEHTCCYKTNYEIINTEKTLNYLVFVVWFLNPLLNTSNPSKKQKLYL